MKPNEIVGPILSAAASFAGFTLVFLGVVITAYQSYAKDIPKSVRRPYRTDALIVSLGFVAGVLSVIFSSLWFVTGGNCEILFMVGEVAFFVQITITLVGASRIFYRVFWG